MSTKQPESKASVPVTGAARSKMEIQRYRELDKQISKEAAANRIQERKSEHVGAGNSPKTSVTPPVDQREKNAQRPVNASAIRKGKVILVRHADLLPKTDEPPEVVEARLRLRTAEKRVSAVQAELADAHRKYGFARNDLNKALEKHGLIATKQQSSRRTKKQTDLSPRPARTTPSIPSHLETGKMVGMGSPVPPADKALRNAREAVQDGFVHLGTPRKRPKQKHKGVASNNRQRFEPPPNYAISEALERVRVVNDRAMERDNDATKDYRTIRDGGRFGSHSAHDRHEDYET